MSFEDSRQHADIRVWIGVARLTGEPHTVGVAVTTFVVAAVIVVAPCVRVPARTPALVR